MTHIEIVSMPPSDVVPPTIQQAWVGAKMAVIQPKPEDDSFLIYGEDGVQALRDMGEMMAAAMYSDFTPSFFRIGRKYCRVVLE